MRVEPSKAEVGIYTWGNRVKRNYVPQASYVINVAGLRDPQSNRGFRKIHADGRPGEVQTFVKEDPRYPAILDTVRMLTEMHLRSEGADGKWLSIGIMDHHGQWIAPAIGEAITDSLVEAGFQVSLFHYDLINNTSKT